MAKLDDLVLVQAYDTLSIDTVEGASGWLGDFITAIEPTLVKITYFTTKDLAELFDTSDELQDSVGKALVEFFA